MLYYRYGELWERFFCELGCDITISGETNKKIMDDGIKYSIDECCLPAKIYMGHVYSLIGKCDYILVPRIDNYGRDNQVCVKFNALYDIVRNTFEQAELIDYNIDAIRGAGELKGFLSMGRMIGKKTPQSLSAFIKAKRFSAEQARMSSHRQQQEMEQSGKPKILIVAHNYNTHDRMLGQPVISAIKSMGGIPVCADAADKKLCAKSSGRISDSLYWLYNKELVGAVGIFKDRVDGIILLSAFPCGPDSLVNELLIRKIRDIPIINIVLDELNSGTGLQTRLESFMEIITMQNAELRMQNENQCM
ncbi:MAG: acyl-CoA dehydratase activase-related protein [Oscillospiraceae bacterium]|nr:acyl-CoA dehydratase activase-related protein [Oscillospiraceae bacterium]